jgi:hypothetical protein
MTEFKNGIYDLLGVGESEDLRDLKRSVILETFVIKDGVIETSTGGENAIFPLGPIHFLTAYKLHRYLNDGHGYCLLVFKSAS